MTSVSKDVHGYELNGILSKYSNIYLTTISVNQFLNKKVENIMWLTYVIIDLNHEEIVGTF